MRAVGLSQKTIAAKLDISQQTVSHVLKREHVQVDIAALSQGVKEALMARADRLALKAMSMAEDKVDHGDAKSFDQAMRGVHSGERIRSSVVNEPKKVEMVGSVQMSQSETNQLFVDLLQYWRELVEKDPKDLIRSLGSSIARLREREAAATRPLRLPAATP